MDNITIHKIWESVYDEIDIHDYLNGFKIRVLNSFPNSKRVTIINQNINIFDNVVEFIIYAKVFE